MSGEAILVTGASGFLGSLVAAEALLESDATVVLPIRQQHTRESVLAPIAAEMAAEGRPPRGAVLDRVVTLPLPDSPRIDELVPALERFDAVDLLHCAGSLSYFNVKKLHEGNLDLTAAFLRLGAAVGVRRFVYLSTTYSSGFTDGPIAERLHDTNGTDPTDYTRTKREAEWLVAESGLPWVIVRPSIVIGDSRDGRYAGKPYGVYQLWTAAVRYLSGSFPPVLHVVAAEKPLNVLHQDAFKHAFWAAYRSLPDGTVLHVASDEASLPTMRDLWGLWMHTYGGPREVHFYDSLAQVPVDQIDPQLRLLLDFTSVNNEIASVHWAFELEGLRRLRHGSLRFTDATLETVERVQQCFVAGSPDAQRFIEGYQAVGHRPTRLIPH
jgi:nucleoside-diphosphate-sugar epimerase